MQPDLNMMKQKLKDMSLDEFISVCLNSGKYSVDYKQGIIFLHKGDVSRRLREYINHAGYVRISFNYFGVDRKCRVHRVIWIAAHGNLSAQDTIDHINNIKTDNRLANLQVLSLADNVQKAIDDKIHPGKLSCHIRRKIFTRYHAGEAMQKDLATEYHVSQNAIHEITSGRRYLGPAPKGSM